MSEPSTAPAGERPGRRLGYLVCQQICLMTCLMYFRLRVYERRHVPASGGALLVCNHQSYLDPVLAAVALTRECDFVARDTLFHHPVFAGLIRYLNALPIRRGSADIGAIKETLRRLRDQRIVTVFPEASRSRDGSIAPMQAGTALIARKAGVPMIPTLIDGAFRAWPRHARVPRPGPVRIAYGPPLTPADLTRMSDADAMDELRNRILQLKARYGRG